MTTPAAPPDHPPAPSPTRKRLLDPVDRTSEVLFGLIMVLTFTGSLSAGDVARDDVRAMLVGALGCNLAWGMVDAAMYFLAALMERARQRRLWCALQGRDDESARLAIAEALPDFAAAALSPQDIERIRLHLCARPESPAKRLFHKDDYLGAVGVFLLVFLTTFPVVLPFIFMHDARAALHVSNAIAIVMLFIAGYRLARHAGLRPWRTGLAMVVIGSVLVAITMALGG